MGLFTSTAAIATKNIFISYRVSDTAGETGRLVDTLKQYFYEEQIFIDIEKIEPGVDFTVAISKSLEACDVLLAIIGPNWQGLNTTTNKSRIHNADDWVRIEISTALKRNIRVVPVLVDGGSLPSEEELPEDLKPLVRRQAYEISNKRWKYDTEQLIRFLVKLGIPTKPIGTPPPQKNKSWWSQNYLWVSIVGIALIIISALISNISEPDPIDPGPSPYDTGTVINPNPVRSDPEVEPGLETIQTNAIEAVNGIWYDANGLYYLDIAQNGAILNITSYSMAGQPTGQGSGTIANRQVSLSVNVVDFGVININAALSSDKLNLNGTTRIENNGASYSEPLHLIKR
jgi:hypothetical protein